MYGHSHNNDTYHFSPEFLAAMTPLPPPHAGATDNIYFPPPPPPLSIPAYELDSVYPTSSGGYDSPSYATSPGMQQVLQRSGSSHSIATHHQLHNGGFFNQTLSSPTPTPTELLDSEGSSSTTMRRVFSFEDLQGTKSQYHRSESPLSSESNSIIESMTKACRYSPDEKKERIERYRTKKTQRNFTKKIKYVCRKTLADSRPRIRGRFARNEEIEKAMEHHHHHHRQGSGEEQVFDDDEDEVNWMNNIFDSCPPNFIP